MASSEKTESVNAVYIEHLTKSVENLSKAVALSAKEFKIQLDKVLTLLDKYKDDTKNRQAETDKIANEIRNEIIALTKSNEDTKQLCVKHEADIAENKASIAKLETKYVSRQYLHKWVMVIGAIVIASIAWQDLQTQRYFNKLESTIALTDAQNKELEHYRHLLKNDFLEAYQHFQKAKKGM